MAGISTHVLNLTTGRPIAGMRVELYDVAQTPAQRLNSTRTNADGRTDAALLSVHGLSFHSGTTRVLDAVAPV